MIQPNHHRPAFTTVFPQLRIEELIRRGSNDVFRASADGVENSSILRVTPHQPHPLQNIISEKVLIDGLRKHGISCPAMSQPFALSCGNLVGYDGAQAAVLFSRVDGRSPRESQADFYSWGVAVGKLHSVVTLEEFPRVQRETMSGELLTKMLIYVLENGNLSREQRTSIIRNSFPIPDLADKLCIREPLILCHGDLGPSNVLISDEGRANLIDFDFSCIAPKSYDLAVWNDLLSLEFVFNKNTRDTLSKSFWDGYRMHHPDFSPNPELIQGWTKVFRFLAVHYIVWSEMCRFPAKNYSNNLDLALTALSAAST